VSRWTDYTKGYLARSIAVKRALLEGHAEAISDMGSAVAAALAAGHKLLIFGNGGSAADAQHLATELVVRFSGDFEREALPAIALTTDTSLLTACSNDYGYDRIFARQVEAFGRPGDVALGISTSGNSKNVIAAFETARARELTTVLFAGETGGKLLALSDHSVCVPSTVTSHIQESHLATLHLLCEIIERQNYGKGGA
jgi:D-sedoheptulose 7-phosphate isomerase